MFKNPCKTIIIIIIIALLLLWWLTRQNQFIRITEPFITDPSPELNQFYELDENQLRGLDIDMLKCDKQCCGDSWYIPFDNLTPAQIQRKIAEGIVGDSGPYVRTNMTCANGPNGVGCPCIPKDAYLNLANRGQNTNAEEVNPTFWLGSDVGNNNNDTVPQRYWTQDNKSVFVPTPKLNDMQLQRQPQDISNIQLSPY